MNDLAPEAVEDNGNSLMNHHEEGTGSPQQANKLDGPRGESPGGSVHSSTRKGFGLKKWRRIKRDGPVKDESTPVDDGTKLLKRGLTDSVNPPSKHVDLSSVEARQSSEGSVGSVNMVHHQYQANGFSPDSGFMFSLGQASEKGEEHIGSFLGAKNVGGKKGSEERVEVDKEKPCSSLDSDLRSSDFVFSSGAVSVANNGEKDERLMNHSRSENGYTEENGDESKTNYDNLADKDPLADSMRSFAALQEALWKEVQSFQELGKDSIPLDSNTNELSSSDQSGNGNCKEENSTPSGSHALNLKQKVHHLETKLEEARATLEAKEAKIQELENSKTETELEGIFQRKIETEIEHLMLTRSLQSHKALKQHKKVHFLIEDPESSHGDMLGKSYKYGFYFSTQLILLVCILWFLLVLQYSPASLLVIPT